jgi:hypothetical protein
MIVQSQILNAKTLCWEFDGIENLDARYLLSEGGDLVKEVIMSGALFDVSMRHCPVGPDGKISRVGHAATRSPRGTP